MQARAETLGFKMVKQTNLARVTLAPKQAQIAENSTALTRMNIPVKTAAKSWLWRNMCEPG